jgi:hypothetical protein
MPVLEVEQLKAEPPQPLQAERLHFGVTSIPTCIDYGLWSS